MKFVDFLNSKAVVLDLKSEDKNEILKTLVELIASTGGVDKKDTNSILKKIKERETLGSTGIGKGIGIPHAKCPLVKKMVAAIGVSKKGIDFKSLDGEPTYIVVMLIAPGDNPGPHLKALAKISRLLDDKFVRDRLRSATSNKELIDIIKTEEQKQLT